MYILDQLKTRAKKWEIMQHFGLQKTKIKRI